jgi:hypothetical protein
VRLWFRPPQNRPIKKKLLFIFYYHICYFIRREFCWLLLYIKRAGRDISSDVRAYFIERKSFGILITYKRLMQHEVMKPAYFIEMGVVTVLWLGSR